VATSVSVGISFMAASCGGRTTTDGSGGVDAADDLSTPADAPWLQETWAAPACGAISPVPAGSAWVGAWTFDSVTHTFKRPTSCPDGDNAGNKNIRVERFYLMVLPATNGCYAECVTKGTCKEPVRDPKDPDTRSCSDPARASQPVYVDYSRAETFCQWLGGRLPTVAELVRATQGDADALGIRDLTNAAINCTEHPETMSPICATISRMDFITSGHPPPLYDVGTVPLDVGPFGHKDLFGSVVAWTRTFVNWGSDAFCKLPNAAPDFVTFPPPSQSQHIGHQLAAKIVKTVQSSTNFSADFELGLADDSTVADYLGFRCVF